jgi:hydrogenase maturation protease
MKTLILGIGNILWADEGFGVRCVEAMDTKYAFGEDVELMDGGTQGIYLVHHVQDADNLIVFDAIDYGLEAGEMKVIENDDVPNFMGAKKMSLHQTGFQEVLSTAKLMESYPERLVLIGVQPDVLDDYGGSLTPKVDCQVEPCIDFALKYLKEWGIDYEEKQEPTSSFKQTPIDKELYEQGRPSEQEAIRLGDDRVLQCLDTVYELRDSYLYEGVGNVKSVPIDGRKLFEEKK